LLGKVGWGGHFVESNSKIARGTYSIVEMMLDAVKNQNFQRMCETEEVLLTLKIFWEQKERPQVWNALTGGVVAW